MNESGVGKLRPFSIVKIFRAIATLFRYNWLALIIFTLAVCFVSQALNALSMSALLDFQKNLSANADPAASLALFRSPAYWGGMLGNMAMVMFLFSGQIFGAVPAIEKPKLDAMFAVSVRKMLPMFGIYLLIILGLIVAILPIAIVMSIIAVASAGTGSPEKVGIIVAIGSGVGLTLITLAASAFWSLVPQLMVAENLGVFAAFGRSSRLSKGSRLKIILSNFVFLALYLLLVFAPSGFDVTLQTTLWEQNMKAAFALNWGLTSVASLFESLYLVALYREARIAHEGDRETGLAGVFS